ncbi:methylation-associated defense system protein kinase MAD6 [Streptomyces iranensis]|uniref:non-specific serine/threonine protein kinase n=1 Tax=Streptomyces iranensis TaxID=576784 RepID=A0A060ZKK8_9ACTN|nr:serine/threonine protein kinase [Streptomyces iranensis]MBP2064056.1 serine/threonine protein kinase [Streptomyces iranensis]CDR06538.1 serine/threonine protein kinase [Streptomyces iranensis]
MGARIVAVGEAVNDAERRVIAHLRDHAPDDWTVLHSIEIPYRNQLFEVDLVVVTGHAVYVIDVKGTRGRIEVDGNRWHPARRAPFRSPLPKLRGHAKQLKTILETAHRPLARLYTDALVVLPAPDAVLDDRTPRQQDARDTVTLPDLIGRLADVSRVPTASGRFDTDISTHRELIVRTVQGSSRPPSGPLRFGSWEVIERLSETAPDEGDDIHSEYRAKNALAVQGSGTVRLSVRKADPYAPEAERLLQQKRIGIAYEALGKLPSHPNIVGVRDFFADEDKDVFVTVFDDVPGHALQLHLSGVGDPLTTDAKLRIVRHVLMGLAHAHSRRIAHRELNPSTILIAQNGRAMLTGFEYAKTAQRRTHTVMREAHQIADRAYLAPECHADPSAMGMRSDVYAVGVIGYQLLTGELPFTSATEQAGAAGRLPASGLEAAGVRVELAHWLQKLCATDPAERPTALEALRRLDLVLGSRNVPSKRIGSSAAVATTGDRPVSAEQDGSRGPEFYRELPADFQLGTKYLVRHRLGRPGSFGVAYRVYDTIRSVDRAVKLVLRDRNSILERLRREADVLQRLQHAPHRNVVSMVDADRLMPPDEYPYLVFEFIDGKDVAEVIRGGRMGAADVLRLAIDTARGLQHIHELGVWHCDIKPSNLLWTDDGVKLIDFGIAKTSDSSEGHTYTSPQYTPPDLDQVPADGGGYTDRDLFGLGVTVYEALTGGQHPWGDGKRPLPGVRPIDPRTAYSGFGDLSPGFAEVMLRTISPYRGERFTTAEELLRALEALESARVEPVPLPLPARAELPPAPPATTDGDVSAQREPNNNSFVTHLQTLYSQSRRSNRGTRGLDPHSMSVYIETALDRELAPALREGRHALVVVTGNAGDGKTAFLESFERQARELGAEFGPQRPNGSDFTLEGHCFRTNHDGSQDEGETSGDEVLEEFFAPFTGADESTWPTQNETRLIAINEGRLIDFLSHHHDRFQHLAKLVNLGLAGRPTGQVAAVVNLNARDVAARPVGADGTPQDGESLLERMLSRMTHERFWEDCESCDLAATCYARHNAQTFQHPAAGPQVKRRLRRIYELTQLRGRLHITLRDLRSALAFTLTSGRDCAEIHQLYATGNAREILDSYYFSAHLGNPPAADGTPRERDRLLSLLREADVASGPQPQLDRRLDYAGLLDDRALVTVDGRSARDRTLLGQQFQQLGRSVAARAPRAAAHRRYVDAARRLLYFEIHDEDRAGQMLPFPSVLRFMELLSTRTSLTKERDGILRALNRGEGLVVPERIGDALALKVRDVSGGTIRSFRRFPATGFRLEPGEAPDAAYIESGRTSLRLSYRDPVGSQGGTAELDIRLDLFELLQRFERGYRPSVADLQGQQLALAVFKNRLAAVPYQEVLLTTDGHDLRRIHRTEDSVLHMEVLTAQQPSGDEDRLVDGVNRVEETTTWR